MKSGLDGSSPTGTAHLYVNAEQVATEPITIQPLFFSLSGEGSNVGHARGQPVSSDYSSPGTMHRKPICDVEVSTDSRWRAAGRYRRQ